MNDTLISSLDRDPLVSSIERDIGSLRKRLNKSYDQLSAEEEKRKKSKIQIVLTDFFKFFK